MNVYANDKKSVEVVAVGCFVGVKYRTAAVQEMSAYMGSLDMGVSQFTG
jgi:hypothetical protein